MKHRRVLFVLAICMFATTCSQPGDVIIVQACPLETKITGAPLTPLRTRQTVTLHATSSCDVNAQFSWRSLQPQILSVSPALGTSTVVTALNGGIGVVEARLVSDSSYLVGVAIQVDSVMVFNRAEAQ